MKYQTLEGFIAKPFGREEAKSNDFERKYKALASAHRIAIKGYTKIDDDHLVHITVGSDTNKQDHYDVVLLFFTDDEEKKRGRSFRNYYVKFFSNSPSFIYTYAALYKKEGYLIDAMYNKMDKAFSDVMPEKTNSSMQLSYDKSIFCACRFMMDNRALAFSKFWYTIQRRTPDAFFRAVRDFEDVKVTSEIRTMDKKVKGELKKSKDKKVQEKKANRDRSNRSIQVISPKKPKTNTLSKSISATKRVRPTHSKRKT
jgi:hypothetical protein